MKIPKYKIGDTVIAKGWIYWNLFEVIGGHWEEDLAEWAYTLCPRYPTWLTVRHSKLEFELREVE